MKKLSFKVFLPLLAFAAVIVSLFSGCGSVIADKTYNVQGMNITLTGRFYEQDIVTQTATYTSTDVVVTVLKESFSDLGSSYTNKSYMELVARVNNLNATIEENETYAYIKYNKTVSGKDFYYYATGRKGPDAYWLIQFACLEEETDEHQPDFEKYAASVTFDGVNTDSAI